MPLTPVRRLARRTAAAVIAVTAAAGPLALGAGALDQPASAQQATGQQPATQPSVFIESVSPQWATPNHTVTVSGIVTNGTAEPLDGLSIQLLSSDSPLGNRDDLSLYASGNLDVDVAEGTAVALPGVVAPGHSVRWQATLNPTTVGMNVFGVYPLAAQILNNEGLPGAIDRTFLPFWPGGSPSQLPQKLSIAWVWPILSQPYQAVCQALLSNGLAGSLASGGRLNGLLAAGGAYSSAADLTWAIDPAVAATAQTMSHPYTAGPVKDCGGAKPMPADRAAASWLHGLVSAISGQQVFLTPYSDVDVNALSHVGLDADLGAAFTAGRAAGSQLLHVPASADTIAWPPSELADSGILDSLAINKINTVVLSSSVMPPAGQLPNYTPSAQTSAATGVGSSLHVLLADQTISELLAGASGKATNPGSVFGTEQSFLAQTAMIVAELPNTGRSLVVTPPRLWNPAPGLADGLLGETVKAPWLEPTRLASLAAVAHPSGQVARRAPPAHHVGQNELTPAYLAQVESLSAAIRLQASTFVPAVPDYLQSAITALESADWPGTRTKAAVERLHLLDTTLKYVGNQAKKVRIIDSGHYTLGGSSGRVPVSITNDMTTTVKVRLHASTDSDGRLSIGSFHDLVSIAPGKTTTIALPLRTHTVGVTNVALSLYSPTGTLLPGTTKHLTVQVTRFGTLALVIMCVALGVFVITSSARAIRRSRRDGEQPDNDDENSDLPGPAATASSVRSDDDHPPEASGPAATAGSVGSNDDLANDHSPEDPDEYADARGRARR